MSQTCQAPHISIITVVRNGAADLARTIDSIRRQNYPCLEYVVIDGASTDGTLDVAKDNADIIDVFISEPDAGIYDAMNKGINRSRGEYLLFLNAGDELVVDLNALSPILAEGCSMIYGKANMLHEDGTLSYVKGKPLKSISKLIRGTPLCHQAIFYRRDSIGFYNTCYSIIADRVLTFELLKRVGLQQTKFMDVPIVNYYEGGFSRKNISVWLKEEIKFLRKEKSWFYLMLKCISYFRKVTINKR